MAVMDEFREKREKIRTASAKEKWKYFTDYYLVWTLIGLAVMTVSIAFLYSVLSQKEDALYVSLVNFAPLDSAENRVEKAFSELALDDIRHSKITIDTSESIVAGMREDDMEQENADDPSLSEIMKYSYEDEQKLATLAMTGSMDMMITGEDVFMKYAMQEYIVGLDQVMDSERLKQFEDAGRVLYIDKKPVGICMDDAVLLKENYVYDGKGSPSIYAGFVIGAAHTEMALRFIQFLESGN